MNYPPYAPHPQPQPTREKPQYSIRELVFAFVFLFVALLFSFAMPFRERPLAVLLLSIVLFVQTALYHGKGAIVKKRRPITMLVLYGVFLIPFLTNANATLRFFVFVLLMMLLAFFWYDKAVLHHQPMEDTTVVSHVGEALLSYVSHFHVTFAVIFSTTGRGERAKKGFRTFGFIMLGLGIALLPTVIIWALLSYDDAFNLLMDNIFDFSFEKVFERIWDIMVAIPLGAAFFSLVYSMKAERKEKAIKASRSGGVPRALLYAAVTPMLVLYALFFFSQKDYYLSAFTKTLPEGLTFAEYAREGFFQLCGGASCVHASCPQKRGFEGDPLPRLSRRAFVFHADPDCHRAFQNGALHRHLRTYPQARLRLLADGTSCLRFCGDPRKAVCSPLALCEGGDRGCGFVLCPDHTAEY